MAAVSLPLNAQESGSYDVFLPPDHLLRRQLDEAQSAIDDEQYNTAVRLLGELLSGKAASATDESSRGIEDYFMEPAQEGGAQRSLKSEARQMLAGLPKRGLDSYQLLYGREAELLLQQALGRGDEELLTEVTRKYFYTESGYQAALLLGRIHLSQGRPLAAALSLRQVHDLTVGQRYEPDLSLLLAASWMLADNPDRAHEVLSSLRDRHANTPLQIGDSEVALFRKDGEALDWLRKTLGHVDLGTGQSADQWLVFRGNATRTAPTEGGAPLGQVLWAVPTPNEKKHQLAIEAEQEQYIKQRAPALPGLHPLVLRHADLNRGQGESSFRDVVITRTQRRLLAVDFKTGQRIWFYPHSERGPTASEMASLAAPPSKADTPQLAKLKQRTWMDSPYGQTSSDGDRVYFIHELGLADRVGPSKFVVPGGGLRNNPNSPQAHNALMALDLTREGTEVWNVGEQFGGDEPKLAGAFFLGPPLPLMDRLFAIAEVKGDIRLVVLDPVTGGLQWQQQLCGVDNQSILDDAVRRLGGASPSFSEGVLVCPTSAGAVVAVDVAKRSLLWGYQYLDVPKERRVNGAFFQVTSHSRKAKQPGQAWADSTVTIAGDKVLITPIEHDEIICLDLLQGTLRDKDDGKDKPLWKRQRGDGLYVACVHDGKAVIVGKDSVVAVDIETGEDAWKAIIPDTPKTMPSGRGFASGDAYFLPLTSRELVQIDLRGGRLVDVTPTRGILGNLVCYRDTVVSQGTTELASFYQRDALGRVVERALVANPDDAWALARKAELLLKDGNRAEALDALRRSHELQADDGAKALLVNTLLGALDDDFAANQKLAVEVESLIDRPDQRSAFLRLMAVGLQDIGEFEASFSFFLKIIDDDARHSSPAQGDAQAMHPVSDVLHVHPSRWIRARLNGLLHQVTPQQSRTMSAAIEQRLQKALQSESTAALRRHIEYFGQHLSADKARLALASKLWNAGELLEAELILSDLAQHEREDVAAPATAQLARLLGDAGHIEESAAVYRRLGEEFADVDCGDGKTGRQVIDNLPAESLVATALDETSSWPLGRVEVIHHDGDDSDAPKLGYSSFKRLYPSQLERVQGALPAGMRIVLDRDRQVILRDGAGRQPVSVQLNGSRTSRYYTSNYSITHAKATGHLALVSLGYELFAIDLLRTTSNSGRRILWTKDLTSPITGASATSRQHTVPKLRGNPWGGHEYFAGNSAGNPIAGFTAPLHQGVVYRRWEQLVCFDPLRPDKVHWAREGIKDGAHVFGDDEIVMVVDHNSTIAHMYRALDGVDLGTCKIGDPDETWATLGRRVLRWNKTDQGVTVALFDAWDSKMRAFRPELTVWSHQFSANSKGARIENDEVAVLEPDGKFTIVDLASGEVRFETRLEPEDKLATLHVLRGSDEYIVVANRPIDDAPAGATVQPVPGGYGPQGQYSPLIKGRVYALAKETGESLWPTPAVIEHFGLPLDQPTQLPMITFMRNISTDRGSPSRDWKTEIVCLDKRDGRIAFHKQGIEGNTQVYRIEADPKQKSADLLLPGVSFTLQWTNNPRPPEPPAQLGSATEPPS